MYDMTKYNNPIANQLPAPYELDQFQGPSQGPSAQPTQSFARGGRTGHKGLIAAHVSPHELTIMDHLQGGMKPGPGGIRTYSGLEELLKNPHLSHTIHKHAHQHRQQHAQGGLTSSMEHLREGGRNGDTELAMIGPQTHHLFNQLAGHATRNPNTGHPEYFDISSALGGIWNGVKGAAPGIWQGAKNLFGTAASGLGQAAQAAAPHIKEVARAAAPALIPMAQQALSNRFGQAGDIGGNMLNAGAQSVLGQAPEQANPYHQAFGSAIGQAAQGYQGGASPSQAFGQGLQQFGGQMGGGFGNALQESGQALGQGQGFGQAARAGAQRFGNNMGGRQGMYNAANDVGMGLMRGGYGGARQAAGNQMSQYMQRAAPQFQNQGRNQGYGQQDYGQGYGQQGGYDQYEENPYEIYG